MVVCSSYKNICRWSLLSRMPPQDSSLFLSPDGCQARRISLPKESVEVPGLVDYDTHIDLLFAHRLEQQVLCCLAMVVLPRTFWSQVRGSSPYCPPLCRSCNMVSPYTSPLRSLDAANRSVDLQGTFFRDVVILPTFEALITFMASWLFILEHSTNLPASSAPRGASWLPALVASEVLSVCRHRSYFWGDAMTAPKFSYHCFVDFFLYGRSI